MSDVLAHAEEQLKNKYCIQSRGYDFERLVNRVAEITNLASEEILGGIRDKKRTDARSILCFWAKEDLGITQSQLAKKLNRTQSAISYAVRRGRVLVERNSYSILEN